MIICRSRACCRPPRPRRGVLASPNGLRAPQVLEHVVDRVGLGDANYCVHPLTAEGYIHRFLGVHEQE
jgi:hypothetical protein